MRPTVMRCAAVLLFVLLAGCARGPTYDVVIRHGTVYDGSGGAVSVQDIGDPGGQHRRDRRSEGSAREGGDRRDGTRRRAGLHQHAEPLRGVAASRTPKSQSEIRQGVTLEVFGEFSMGPLSEAMRREAQARQGDIKYEIAWTTLGGYFDYLAKRGVRAERRVLRRRADGAAGADRRGEPRADAGGTRQHEGARARRRCRRARWGSRPR